MPIRSALSSKVFVSFISMTLIAGLVAVAGAETIKIGALYDMAGATADVGKDYARGIDEAIHYINDNGGVNGKKIKLYQYDYGFRVPEALTKYKLFKRLKCVAVLGWGIGDTEALSPTVNKEKMPYVSAFYSAHLTDPKKTPYNLFAATDYSSNARAAITAWFDKKWPKHKEYGQRKPRFVCAFMFDSPYYSAPIKAIKDQAKLLGFDVGPDQDVSLFAIDTKRQVLAMKNFKPDLVWHGNTTMSVAATVRDAYSLGLGAEHIVNNWGFDENLPRLAGKASEGVIGAAVCAFYGEDQPLMGKVVEYGQTYHPGVPKEKRLVRTIQAWSNALALWEALKRAVKAGGLSGENILKNGFETMKGFELGLGGARLTYTDKDHRISGRIPIYEIKGGQIVLLEVVDLKGRWPRKWEKEWLGW
jgi:branched-chain amino acid transport system substrate-binding protein